MPRRPRPGLRNSLLAAARAEFARAGFGRASLDAIGEAAGATKGAVYFLFRSKIEVFAAAVEELQEEFEAALEEAARPGGDPAERLERLLTAYQTFHLDHPEYRKLLLIPSSELSAQFHAGLKLDLREHYRRVRSRMREVLTEGVLAGLLRCEDPAVEAFLLLAALEGVLAQRNADAKDVAALCEPARLVRLLVAPLLTPPGAEARPAALQGSPPEDEANFRPAF